MALDVNGINATKRTETGSGISRRLRREGKTPATVYGLGKKSLSIIMDTKDWDKIAKLDSHIVELNIESQKLNTLVKEVQYNTLSSTTMHVDFLEIDMKEEITASIPINISGEAAGMAVGGMLNQLEYEIEVTSLPTNLPESIEIDISALEIGDSIVASDVILPKNVTLSSYPDATLIQVALPRAQEEETSAEETVVEEATEEPAS